MNWIIVILKNDKCIKNYICNNYNKDIQIYYQYQNPIELTELRIDKNNILPIRNLEELIKIQRIIKKNTNQLTFSNRCVPSTRKHLEQHI